METNRPWENRVARMMRRAGQRVRRERAVFVRAAIDFHLGVVTHNEFFGPLLPALVGRRAVVAVHDDPERQIAELLADPGASILTKRRLMEDIVNKRVETTPSERKISFATAFDRSFREGRREGREEGREEGRREALLEMARTFGLRLDEFAEIADLGELQRRVFDAIKARG